MRSVLLATVLAMGACSSSSPSTPSGSGGGSPTGDGGSSPTGSGGSNPTGTGGMTGTGTGGTSPTGTGGGSSGCAVGATTGAPGFGSGTQSGQGQSTDKYFGTDVMRDGSTYRFITNWWGTGWTSADVSYNGTSFTVNSAAGTSMPDGTPIGYPATYCGQYSENAAHGNCGLPVAYANVDQLWTGWKWSAPANSGQHNAAWDIWLGTSSSFQSYLMVWLRDPAGRQPAGNSVINNVTVANEPGTWSIRYGTVNNAPIVNYVRAEGQDACEFEFNVMDFINDAKMRSATTPALMLPGDTVRAIAVGFEFWTGPFSNIKSEDFYIKLTKK
jgi:hypothetical protein